MARHGRSLDPEQDAGDDPLDEEPALSSCASAAARGVDLVGERAGRPTLRLLDPDRARRGEPVAEVLRAQREQEVAPGIGEGGVAEGAGQHPTNLPRLRAE